LKAYLDTVKRRNAEAGLLAKPRRAGPAAPICGVAVLDRDNQPCAAHGALHMGAAGPAET